MANTRQLSPGKENLEIVNEKGDVIQRHPIVGLPLVMAQYDKQEEAITKRYEMDLETIRKRKSDVQELIDAANGLLAGTSKKSK